MVDDYFADDLFRSPGNRGSTYLFLRWCADRFGPDLLPALIRSPRRGVANLEAATGVPFADLYRQWSTALFLSGLDPSHESEIGFRSLDVRGPFDDWDLAGPRPVRVTPGGAPETWSAAGTSSRFVVVEPPTIGAVEVEVTGPPDAELQVTAIPLPAGMARLDLWRGSPPTPTATSAFGSAWRNAPGPPCGSRRWRGSRSCPPPTPTRRGSAATASTCSVSPRPSALRRCPRTADSTHARSGSAASTPTAARS